MKWISILLTLIFASSCTNLQLGASHQKTRNESVGSVPEEAKQESHDQQEGHEAPNYKSTTTIATGNRLLMSLVACTGVKTPSPRAKQIWQETRGSLSIDGHVASVTPPMLMAQAAVASEVCVDLVNKERMVPAGERRIFIQADFAAGPSAHGSGRLSDITRRLARSCWGRNETSEELALLIESAQQNFTGNNVEDSFKQLAYLCTAMLASVSAIQM